MSEFKFNLKSVHKLCQDASCAVHSSHDVCYIQGPSMTKPLALGKMFNGLYHTGEKNSEVKVRWRHTADVALKVWSSSFFHTQACQARLGSKINK